jgi:hypothetical protein
MKTINVALSNTFYNNEKVKRLSKSLETKLQFLFPRSIINMEIDK